MQCREFREIADSYLNDELLVETNHGFLKHLESCAECRRELAARREVRTKLRAAVAKSPDLQVRPEFAFQLRNGLKLQHAQPARKSFFAPVFALATRPQWLAAACLVVALTIGFVALKFRHTSPNADPQIAQTERRETDASQLDNSAVRLANFEQTRIAVGDHRYCALDFQLDEDPIPLAEAGRNFDPVYTGLTRAVMSGQGDLAGEIKLVEDHSCVYKGTRFAHVVLEYHGRTISVLVAEKSEGGVPTRAANSAPGTRDGQVIACAQIDGYQVSCFETGRHAIYTISDLSEAENLTIARTFASSVSDHIAQAERSA